MAATSPLNRLDAAIGSALGEAFIRAARLRLWEEHLEQPAAGDPCRVVDEIWRPLANESSPEREVRLLRGVSRRSLALWGLINGLLVDG